jgi:rare lipoprotein A
MKTLALRRAATASVGAAVVAVAAGAALILSACSTTTPARRAEEPSASGKTTPPVALTPPKKSGGYYLDDGPGENPPANLDLLPDAVPKVEKLASGANRPYNVFGVDYVPDLSGAPFKQRGVGSWYGRKFHGQRTSSGEIYDMYAMTAAHPTLPIPSYALVTNLSNGKSVIVRVNDRGPFLYHRVMDLSYAAALKLGYLSSGSGMIEVELLLPADIAAGRIPITSNSLYIAAAAAAGRKLDPGATTNVANAPAPGPQIASAATTVAIPIEPSPEATPIASTASPLQPNVAASPAQPASASSIQPAVVASSMQPSVMASLLPAAPALPDAVAASSASTSHADRDIPADLIPVSDPQPAPALPATATRVGYYLQLGAFRVRAGADSFASHVAREIDPAIASKVQVAEGNGLYRVRIGPYAQRADADGAARSLRAAIAQPVLVMPADGGVRER